MDILRRHYKLIIHKGHPIKEMQNKGLWKIKKTKKVDNIFFTNLYAFLYFF